MKRRPIKQYREGRPRRRKAPRWDAAEWTTANRILATRARGRCEHCTKQLDPAHTERHHRMRRRDGGDSIPNVILLRPECHQWITEHPEWATDRGFIVPALGVKEPADVPLLWHGHDWSLLHEDGRVTDFVAPPTQLHHEIP